jgi:hypothetical protein
MVEVTFPTAQSRPTAPVLGFLATCLLLLPLTGWAQRRDPITNVITCAYPTQTSCVEPYLSTNTT